MLKAKIQPAELKVHFVTRCWNKSLYGLLGWLEFVQMGLLWIAISYFCLPLLSEHSPVVQLLAAADLHILTQAYYVKTRHATPWTIFPLFDSVYLVVNCHHWSLGSGASKANVKALCWDYQEVELLLWPVWHPLINSMAVSILILQAVPTFKTEPIQKWHTRLLRIIVIALWTRQQVLKTTVSCCLKDLLIVI